MHVVTCIMFDIILQFIIYIQLCLGFWAYSEKAVTFLHECIQFWAVKKGSSFFCFFSTQNLKRCAGSIGTYFIRNIFLGYLQFNGSVFFFFKHDDIILNLRMIRHPDSLNSKNSSDETDYSYKIEATSDIIYHD